MSYTQELYIWSKARGVCVRCRKQKAAKGKTMCLQCLSDVSYTTYEWYHTLDRDKKKKHNEYRKRKQSLCVAFKVCVACQKKDATKGQKCLECWIKTTKKRNSKVDISRKERHEYGLCYKCGKPAIPGHRSCAKHLELDRFNMANAMKHIDRTEHKWRVEQHQNVLRIQSEKQLNSQSKA